MWSEKRAIGSDTQGNGIANPAGTTHILQDLERNISQIEYNFLNLPKKVQMKSTGNISYVYDALGTRHSKSYYHISPYAYCHNNPISRIAPDGLDDYYTNDGQKKYIRIGNAEWN